MDELPSNYQIVGRGVAPVPKRLRLLNERDGEDELVLTVVGIAPSDVPRSSERANNLGNPAEKIR
jgi:hypothetical protein